jgi:predicted metal-dependent phosphoesterase TrpH
VKAVAGESLLVIPGAELRTDKGDLIALFTTDIQARSWSSAIDEIRENGGISLVPHPGASPGLTKEDIALADATEVFNSTCGRRANNIALKLAEDLQKPGFGSSDAHIISAIGNGRTRVPDCTLLDDLRQVILKRPEVARRQRTNPLIHYGNAVLCFGLKGLWNE